MITSFTPDGEVYEKGTLDVLNFLLERGVHGLFIIGSYGSFALMSTEERKRIAKIIIDEVDGRAPVIVQIGDPSTRTAVELAKHAQDTGAAAVASVIPFYYAGIAYKEVEVVRHFEDIVKAVTIPTYLYNNPKTTGYNLTSSVLLKLVNAGVKGMKDSSGDFMLFAEFMNEVRRVTNDFNFMTGTVGLLQPAYMLGACSCVAGTANAFPELVVELYDALTGKNYDKASELQAKVIDIRKLQAASGFRPAGCYSILKMRGIDPGTVRRPWREPDEKEYAFMKEGLSELGIL